MPDRNQLKTGDKIRLLCVPPEDVEQRKREIANKVEDAGWTANTIELILSQNPMVEIDFIDEYGSPWYFSEVLVNGQKEQHTIAILEDNSWAHVK